MRALRVLNFVNKFMAGRQNVTKIWKSNLFIHRRLPFQKSNVFDDAKSEENECLNGIMYNEVLWEIKNKLNVKKRERNLKQSIEPICLNYLIEDRTLPPESISKGLHISKGTESEVLHLPYEVTEKYITEAAGNRSILQAVPDDVANFTPTDNSKITPPHQWTIDHEAYNEEIINDNIADEIRFGTPDLTQPISNEPCGGCGALLHCSDPGLPGFLPKEVFLNVKKKKLKSEICQRCYFLKEFDIALGVNVSPKEYPRILSQIKNKNALAILMVDLLDFPCSIWPGILEIIGHKPVIVVGNKIDLLIQENPEFEKQIMTSLVHSLSNEGLNMKRVKDLHLISAKTGYGVEKFISSVSRNWGTKGDMYLIGCTNVGKSTLFNALIHSDICRIEAENVLKKATISSWPGTTLNLLKFPVKKIYGKLLQNRTKRLIKESKKKSLQKKFGRIKIDPKFEQMPLIGVLERTKERERDPEDFQREFDFSHSPIDENKMGLDPLDPNFRFCKWCYDTPGVIQRDQIINFLTAAELILTLPKQLLIPRNFNLTPGTSLFIAGLARLDYIQGTDSAWFTVFASKELPVTITSVENADFIYRNLLGSNLFRVPCGGKKRLSKWPQLASKSLEICGRLSEEASGDIVLSSAGWVSVTLPAAHYCQVLAWTPEGRGIHLRQTPVISKGHVFRGKKIGKTPAYNVLMKEVERK